MRISDWSSDVCPSGLLAPLGVAALGRNRKWVRRAGLTTAAACATFFRHPHRVPPNRIGVVVAPADGEVALVDNAVPPAELNLGKIGRAPWRESTRQYV